MQVQMGLTPVPASFTADLSGPCQEGVCILGCPRPTLQGAHRRPAFQTVEGPAQGPPASDGAWRAQVAL